MFQHDRPAVSCLFVPHDLGVGISMNDECVFFKYELFSVSWQIMLCGYVADTTKKPFNRVEMDKYITIFDSLWKEWNDLSKENDDCPSLYKISSNFFGFPVGIQETVDKYRK